MTRIFLALLTVAVSSSVPDTQGEPAALGRWLTAAATADNALLVASTSLPFEYRTTNVKKTCEGIVRDEARLRRWSECFRRNERSILDDLKGGTKVSRYAPNDLPSADLLRATKRIHGDGKWSLAYLMGNGTIANFAFRTDATGKLSVVVLDMEFYE